MFFKLSYNLIVRKANCYIYVQTYDIHALHTLYIHTYYTPTYQTITRILHATYTQHIDTFTQIPLHTYSSIAKPSQSSPHLPMHLFTPPHTSWHIFTPSHTSLCTSLHLPTPPDTSLHLHTPPYAPLYTSPHLLTPLNTTHLSKLFHSTSPSLFCITHKHTISRLHHRSPATFWLKVISWVNRLRDSTRSCKTNRKVSRNEY